MAIHRHVRTASGAVETVLALCALAWYRNHAKCRPPPIRHFQAFAENQWVVPAKAKARLPIPNGSATALSAKHSDVKELPEQREIDNHRPGHRAGINSRRGVRLTQVRQHQRRSGEIVLARVVVHRHYRR